MAMADTSLGGVPDTMTTRPIPPCRLPPPTPGAPMPDYPTQLETSPRQEERAREEYAELAELARSKLRAAFSRPLLAALDAVEAVTDPDDIQARAEQAIGARPDLDR